jgi:hypothetical protein
MNKNFLINLPDFKYTFMVFILCLAIYLNLIYFPNNKMSKSIKNTLISNNDENFKLEGQFPKTFNETKTLINQMITHEITTNVVGEEGNHEYPLSSAFCSETYNNLPSARNEYDMNLNSRKYDTTYAIGEDGTPITNVLTVHSQEEGSPLLCPKMDDGGLGKFD